ncbi:MAG: hypothetical protein NZ455_00070 [Bacteroidia bacterium]|nr:hypothetical protein [Bacteroidia bacterium]
MIFRYLQDKLLHKWIEFDSRLREACGGRASARCEASYPRP